jgi:hypothetical protein
MWFMWFMLFMLFRMDALRVPIISTEYHFYRNLRPSLFWRGVDITCDVGVRAGRTNEVITGGFSTYSFTPSCKGKKDQATKARRHEISQRSCSGKMFMLFMLFMLFIGFMMFV